MRGRVRSGRAESIWVLAFAFVLIMAGNAIAEDTLPPKDILVYLDGSSTIVNIEPTRPSSKLDEMLRALFQENTAYGKFIGTYDGWQLAQFGQTVQIYASGLGPKPSLDTQLKVFSNAREGIPQTNFKTVFSDISNKVAHLGDKPIIILIASDFVHDPQDNICSILNSYRASSRLPVFDQIFQLKQSLTNKIFYIGLLRVTPDGRDVYRRNNQAKARNCFNEFVRDEPLVKELKTQLQAEVIEFESFATDVPGFVGKLANDILARLVKPVDVKLDQPLRSEPDDTASITLTLGNPGKVPNRVNNILFYANEKDTLPTSSHILSNPLRILPNEPQPVTITIPLRNLDSLLTQPAFYVRAEDTEAPREGKKAKIADSSDAGLRLDNPSVLGDQFTLRLDIKNDGLLPRRPQQLEFYKGENATNPPAATSLVSDPSLIFSGSSRELTSRIPDGLLTSLASGTSLYTRVKDTYGRNSNIIHIALPPQKKLRITRVNIDPDKKQLLIAVSNEYPLPNTLKGFSLFKNTNELRTKDILLSANKELSGNTNAIAPLDYGEWDLPLRSGLVYLMTRDASDRNDNIQYDRAFGYVANFIELKLEITSSGRQYFVGRDAHFRVALDYSITRRPGLNHDEVHDYPVRAFLVYKADNTKRVPLRTIPERQIVQVRGDGTPIEHSIIVKSYTKDQETLLQLVNISSSDNTNILKQFDVQVELEGTTVAAQQSAVCTKDICHFFDALRLSIQQYYAVVAAAVLAMVVFLCRSFGFSLHLLLTSNFKQMLFGLLRDLCQIGLPASLLIVTLYNMLVELGANLPYSNSLFVLTVSLCLLLAASTAFRIRQAAIERALEENVNQGVLSSLETLHARLRFYAWVWGAVAGLFTILLFWLFSPPITILNLFS